MGLLDLLHQGTEPLSDSLDIKPEKKPTIVEKITEALKLPTEKEELLRQIQNKLADYNYKESDIPNNDEYWGMLDRYRVM